jgi:hypothetical protein
VIAILAAVGWLGSLCSHSQGMQPTQIAPPLAPTLAPIATTSTTTPYNPGLHGDCWGGDDCHGGLTPSTPMYTPPTTLPPAVPPTLLPQQTVPGVPMVPPGGTLPTTTDRPGEQGHHGNCPPTNWCPDTPVPDEPLPPQPTVVF